MEVGELLAYKPDMALKHVIEDNSKERGRNADSSGRPRKRSRHHHHHESRSHSRSTPTQSRPKPPVAPVPQQPTKQQQQTLMVTQAVQDKLKELEARQPIDESQGPLDEAHLRKVIMNFEKKVLKNQELRIKFPEDPRKFMESEIELNEGIEELHVLATAPELYPVLVELGAIRTMLSLFSHDNTDVAIAAVDLLQEMTDVEGVGEDEGAEDLVEGLMEGQVVATLVHNLNRLEETNKQEADGVHNSLGIIENLAELHPAVCSEAGPGGLMVWLLKRLKSKLPFDANKLYASEILAICLQNNEENRRLIGEMDGIDVLLQQLAVYKRHDPNSSEEQELMENLFDCLCCCLMLFSNRELFLRAEGLQLMNLMLREKKVSRNGALRVLDHALTGTEGVDNCNKFIDILGLRTIFPLFMKTPNKHGKKGLNRDQHEEHVISILSWLLRNCRPNQRQRLINKFTENDHEKVDRLLELHFKYLEKVLATNYNLEEQVRAEELAEDEVYLRRLDGGLFCLQLVDYVMLDICATGPPAIKRRVLKILNVRNASVKTIKNIMREYATNIGEDKDDDDENASAEQDKILALLDKFQNM